MIPPSSSAAAGSGSGGLPLDRTLRCRMVAAGAAKPQVHFRAKPPVSVHEALGLEADPGTVSSELLLAILGNCLIDRIRANAAIGNIPIVSLILEIEADLPVSPLWGNPSVEPAPAGFEAINVSVHMDAAAPEAALRALINHAVIWSPVANTLNGPVHLNVSLAPAPVS